MKLNTRVSRLMSASVFALMIGMSAPIATAQDAPEISARQKFFYWFPNRVLDFLDIFRVGIGFGPGIGGEIAFTEKHQFGKYVINETGVGWYGSSADRKLVTHQGYYKTKVKGTKREESRIDDTARFRRGELDDKEWDVRGEVALGLVHPYLGVDFYEVMDFVTGFTLVDLKNDDMQPSAFGDANPPRKLGRGLVNVTTGVIEIPKNILSVDEGHGGFAALSWGTLRGVKRFVIREMVGVYEVLTFPTASEPIIEPEFPFEPQTADTNWRLKENF